MRSRLVSIPISILAALAAPLATTALLDWVFERVPSIGENALEVMEVGAILSILTAGFIYLVRTLRLGWIAGVVCALVYFPLMLLMEFCLMVLIGLSDMP